MHIKRLIIKRKGCMQVYEIDDVKRLMYPIDDLLSSVSLANKGVILYMPKEGDMVLTEDCNERVKDFAQAVMGFFFEPKIVTDVTKQK